MGVLWLLTVAIICHSTHSSKAWPEVGATNQGSLPVKTSLPVVNNRLNNTLIAPNDTARISTLREKRGTLLLDDDQEKRGGQKLKFSSWAGKRSEELDEDKRAKFSSWGGKRNDEDSNTLYDTLNSIKRAKFSSWGGKRDYLDDAVGNRAFSSLTGNRDNDEFTEEKRTKFNSWAGKRMSGAEGGKRTKFSSWAGKRGKFNSWAGKRSDPDVTLGEQQLYNWDEKPESEQSEDDFSADKRAKFSSWAGKRSPDYIGNTWNKISPGNRMKYYASGLGETGSQNIMKLWQDLISRKRARFSSWAGKRSDETEAEGLERFLDSQEEEKRAKFSSWAGKREDPEKRRFSSWGGKRDSDESFGNQYTEEKESYPARIVKRSAYSWSHPQGLAYKRKPIFSSWGGKRNDPHTIQARSAAPIVFLSGHKPWGTLMRPIRRQPEFYAWGGKRSVS